MFGGSSFGGRASFAEAGSEEKKGDVPETQPVGGRREDTEHLSRAASNAHVCRLGIFGAE